MFYEWLCDSPAGNRVFKSSTAGGIATNRKYIVDVVGDLPVILMELEPAVDGSYRFSVKKAYIYANSQVLAQYDGSAKYFYMHDRLGSVRQMINTSGAVVKMYTYNPYGETLEEFGNADNAFKFTGQYWDSEIGQYYLRARQYSPYLGRFTGRDLVMGQCEEPLTLHRYLYCVNNAINHVDPRGLFIWNNEWVFDRDFDADETQEVLRTATEFVGRNLFQSPFEAFGWRGPEGMGIYDMKNSGCKFTIGESILEDTEFGNYLAGYSTFYNYLQFGEYANRGAGHFYSVKEYGTLDGPDSKYFISAGILKAQADLGGAKTSLDKMSFIKAKFDLYYGIEMKIEPELL